MLLVIMCVLEKTKAPLLSPMTPLTFTLPHVSFEPLILLAVHCDKKQCHPLCWLVETITEATRVPHALVGALITLFLPSGTLLQHCYQIAEL